MVPNDETQSLPFYNVRITGPARSDIDAAHAYLAETAGELIADEWQDGLLVAINRLSTTPLRQPAPESRFFDRVVRQTVFRRRPGSVAYRVLFVVDEINYGGPAVTIIHVRHGSRRPLRRWEAREIDTED